MTRGLPERVDLLLESVVVCKSCLACFSVLQLVARLTKDIVEIYQICNPQFRYSEELNLKRFLTSPSTGLLNDGCDNANSDLILTVNYSLVNSETNRRYGFCQWRPFLVMIIQDGTGNVEISQNSLFTYCSTWADGRTQLINAPFCLIIFWNIIAKYMVGSIRQAFISLLLSTPLHFIIRIVHLEKVCLKNGWTWMFEHLIILGGHMYQFFANNVLKMVLCGKPHITLL